jgi:hypothetical protein
MAVTAVSVKKFDSRRWTLTITVDGDDVTKTILIPQTLPDGVATNEDYMKIAAKRIVSVYRIRKLSQLDDPAIGPRPPSLRQSSSKWQEEKSLWVTSTDEPTEASKFLTDLQLSS